MYSRDNSGRIVELPFTDSTKLSRAPSSVSRPVIELSIIVPTFKERENIEELVARIHTSLKGVRWEIIFVDDDSPDGTGEVVRSLAGLDTRVRCLQRIGRRGLSSACIEGMLASSAPYIAVMDADLQHDEAILPYMLSTLRENDLDIVVGSRYVVGGDVGKWDEKRVLISRLATHVSHFVVPRTLLDPMSGFFMIRRDAFMCCVRHLSALGFKILVDLFASSKKPLRFREIPFEFRVRVAGESKLDGQAAWNYGMLLLDKLIGHILPVRFIPFALVGGLGVVVHMMVLALLFKSADVGFAVGQASAAAVAMVFNYAVNNVITYRDKQLAGWSWWRGLATFVMACSLGALANVGIADYLFHKDGGWVGSALAGILIAAVWNYAVTSVYTWGKKSP